MKTQNDTHLSPIHILPPLLAHATIAPILAGQSLPLQVLLDALATLRAGKRVDGKDADKTSGGGPGEFLSKYCSDLTQQAEDGKLDPVIGREAEVSQKRLVE